MAINDSVSLPSMKEAFPFFKNFAGAYLDSCATAQRPQVMLDALTDFYTHLNISADRSTCGLGAQVEKKRAQALESIASFFGALPAQILPVASTTAGINLLAYSLEPRLQKGDEILVTQAEHHANFLPWFELAKRTGALLQILPIHEDGDFDFSALETLVTAKTKIVSFTGMSNVIGKKTHFEPLVTRAKEVGAITIMDAAQLVCHHLIDFQSLDIDFLVFSAHKLYGPLGLGIVIGKDWERLQPHTFGGGMVQTQTLLTTPQIPEMLCPVYHEGLPGLMAGTQDNAALMAFAASLHFLKENHWPVLLESMETLAHYFESQLSGIPQLKWVSTATQREGIFAFMIDGIDSYDIAQYLSLHTICLRQGLHCAAPIHARFQVSSSLRFSMGIYTTREDIETTLATLKRAIEKFAPPQLSPGIELQSQSSKLAELKAQSTGQHPVFAVHKKYEAERDASLPPVDFDALLGVDKMPSFYECGRPLPTHLSPLRNPEAVVNALKTVIDPELHVNVYDLGLIYETLLNPQGDVRITMTLTSPFCPLAHDIPKWVGDAVAKVPGVGLVHVHIIWEPEWTLAMLSEDAKFQLNMMEDHL